MRILGSHAYYYTIKVNPGRRQVNRRKNLITEVFTQDLKILNFLCVQCTLYMHTAQSTERYTMYNFICSATYFEHL
jgi:hypothetical protein